jgi:hypothetical protein
MTRIDIVFGQATGVQLAGEGAMRVFVREDDGREGDFDFPSDKVGVRDGHRIVIVRASDKAAPEPANILLFNVSTGEREEFGLGRFTERAPAIGPKWSAALIALGIGTAFFFYFALALAMGALGAFFWAAFIAFVLYWPLWGVAWIYAKIAAPIRAERARNAIRAEIEGRLAAHVRTPAPTQAQTGGQNGTP